MGVADEMRICAAAKINHCERLLDAHNPVEAGKWRAAAWELQRLAANVELAAKAAKDRRAG